MPSHVIVMNGKKFVWDSVDHPSREKVIEAMNKYKADGFEVERCEEEGKTYLYTRRVVKHAVAPGA